MKKVNVFLTVMVFAFALAFDASAKALSNMTLLPEMEVSQDSVTAATDFKLKSKSVPLTIGGSGYDIKVSAVPEGSSLGTIKYNYDSDCIKVDDKGHITALKPTDSPIKITVSVDGLNNTLDFTVTKINSKSSSNSGQQSTTSKQIAELNSRIDTLKSVVKSMETELKAKNSELSELKKQQDDSQKELDKYKSSSSSSAKNKRILITILVVLGVLLIAVIVLLYLLNSKMRDTEDELDYEKKRSSAVEVKYSSLESGIMQLNDKINRLKEDNCRLKNENDKLQEELNKFHHSEEKQDVVERANNEERIERKQPQKKSVSLYSDAIIDGTFNRVKGSPDEDTIFELILNDKDSTSAKVVIYSEAKKRVIANPSFLEGCEKQILPNGNDVYVEKEGVAEKDLSTGNWILKKAPRVIIK